MTELSPTPLTDVHRTRFYELPTDASKHDCITLALSAISALEDTERSLAERDARIADQAGRIEILRDVISARDAKIAALEARNAALVKALQSYANGRCYPCGWPLKATVEEGCVIGNCSYRPSERAHDYQRWHDRSELLSAALTEQR